MFGLPEYFWLSVSVALVMLASGVAIYLVEVGVAKIRKAGSKGR